MRRWRPKKLYIYIIKTFIPLLLAGFSVSLFVVVIQFLWQSIGNLVGKGVDGLVLLKLLFFASMTMVPLALVLGVLVASLMTFGNLGDRMELLAMKAAGIPLYKILKPVFYFVVALAFGLFVFQNDWMIMSQVKFWQYYFSIKNKAPELAIPEGSFYKGVDNYSIFVGKKDNTRKVLYDIMVYDYTSGFDQSMVVVADSGRLYSTTKGMELILELYSGESFQNLSGQGTYSQSSADRPFIRERFGYKELHIPFNTDLSMVDESILSSQFVGKNMGQLKHYTDSLRVEIDSLAQVGIRNSATQRGYQRVAQVEMQAMEAEGYGESGDRATATTAPDVARGNEASANRVAEPINIEEVLHPLGAQQASAIYGTAISIVAGVQNDTYFTVEEQRENVDLLRKNESEYWRKVTYPVACIAFFLIGAPLGALIRKGGMGVPFLVAVALFIFFYILETFGIKMAREGTLLTWVGMWLPNMVLIPIGVALCVVASRDTNRLNLDFLASLKGLLGVPTKREIEYKEVTMETVDYQKVRAGIAHLGELLEQQQHTRRVGYAGFFLNDRYFERRHELSQQLEKVVNQLKHSRDYTLVSHLNGYPTLNELIKEWRSSVGWVNRLLMVLFPIGLLCYLLYIMKNNRYIGALKATSRFNEVLLEDIERVDNDKTYIINKI